ncbi:MAG TPA: hypothetical protein VMV17_16590 [Streptosporangiaceae bacterium]|nr:hypothetical protein [Streptosporangiaceae bacterium]
MGRNWQSFSATNASRTAPGMPGAAAGAVATSLELAALPSAVPCARLHTKQPPVRAEAGPDGESGRGLVLVQALSTRWGYYYPERPPRGRARGPVGKIVWALCG